MHHLMKSLENLSVYVTTYCNANKPVVKMPQLADYLEGQLLLSKLANLIIENYRFTYLQL